MTKSNIYEVNAQKVLTNYASYVVGNANCRVIAIASNRFSNEAKNAIEKSLEKLGFLTHSCSYVTLSNGQDRLAPADLRMLVEGLDPKALISCDSLSTDYVSTAYDNALVDYAKRNRVLGRSVICFKDFESMLISPESKQQAWHILKMLVN